MVGVALLINSLVAVCRIPGALNDRRTMLGELNWIFTAITDTIAWNVLSRGKQFLLLCLLNRNLYYECRNPRGLVAFISVMNVLSEASGLPH